MNRKILFTLCCTMILSNNVRASEMLEKLSNAGVEVRKSFVGSAKDQASPASFNISGGSNSDNNYNIDLAIKVSDHNLGFKRDGLWRGRLYPSIEFHKNTDERSESDNVQGALSFEFERGLGSCLNRKDPYCTSLIVDASLKAKRDSFNDKTSQSSLIYVTLVSAKDYWPSDIILFGDSSLKLSYYPFIGMEYHRNLPIVESVNGEKVEIAGVVDEKFSVARLNVGVYPFSKSLDDRLMLVFDYYYRHKLGSSEIIKDTNVYVELSINYFFDDKNRFALGLNYSHGRSPARNFFDEERWGVGFKFKL